MFFIYAYLLAAATAFNRSAGDVDSEHSVLPSLHLPSLQGPFPSAQGEAGAGAEEESSFLSSIPSKPLYPLIVAMTATNTTANNPAAVFFKEINTTAATKISLPKILL